MTRYLVAVLVTAAVVGIRWFLNPWLGENVVFAPLLAAVAIAVWHGGRGPAVLALVLGVLAYGYLFLEPIGSFAFRGADAVGPVVLHVLICCVVIGFGEAMRTARLRAQEYAEQLRTTLASIGDGVIATDDAGRVTMLNGVAESLTGWTSQEAVGQPLEAVFRIANEQTRRPVENPVQRVIRNGQIVGLGNHTVLFARDGTVRPIDDSAAPICRADGTIAGCVLVFRDVTDRRRTEETLRVDEERYRAVVESQTEMICRFRVDGTILFVNEAYARARGTTTAVLEGANFWEFIAEEDRPAVRGMLARLRPEAPEVRIENRFETADGIRWTLWTNRGLRFDEDGRAVEVQSTGIDITERKLVEDALRESEAELTLALAKRTEEMQRAETAERQLLDADRRKDEFLATLAHELRNPLAPIRNALQVLLRKNLADPGIRWIGELIDRQVRQMARLLDDLLDVSRITHNRLELRRQRIDLADVVQAGIETSRPLLDERGMDLEVILPDGPVPIDADPVRLGQVVANLVNNAARYSEPGGHVRVDFARQGSEAVISVSDQGIGIAPELLPRVFDIFMQAHPSRERSQGGLGIGLSLVRGVVELHGGRVEARSQGVGKGSEFIVRLPLVVEPVAPEAGPVRVHAPPEHVMRRRILVVDDLEDSADSLALLLQMAGHEVHTAYEGDEAFRVADKLRPEVIMLDIGMPKVSGYDVCRRIRQQPWGESICLVALTGWGQDADRRRSMEAGFDRHLVKPVDPAELTRLLASAKPTTQPKGA